MKTEDSKLKRQRDAMPGFFKQALEKCGLMQAYKERPAYQQNDYIGWIKRANKQERKEFVK